MFFSAARHFGDGREQILHPVRARTDDENGDSAGGYVLLIREALVQRQQDIEKRLRQRQQVPVLLASPSAFGNGPALMTRR
jgi:hypothetical protein